MALREFIKENIVLVVGLALPVLLIALFFVASVLPKSVAVPPQYEMLFTTSGYDHRGPHPYSIDFFVKNETLMTRVAKLPTPEQQNYYYPKRIMIYNGKTESVRELSYNISRIGDVPNGTEIVLEEFKDMKISNSSKAPDGYELDAGGYHSGGLATELFVGGYGRNSARVVKGSVAFKIPGENRDYYYSDIQFLGWIIQK